MQGALRAISGRFAILGFISENRHHKGLEYLKSGGYTYLCLLWIKQRLEGEMLIKAVFKTAYSGCS